MVHEKTNLIFDVQTCKTHMEYVRKKTIMWNRISAKKGSQKQKHRHTSPNTNVFPFGYIRKLGILDSTMTRSCQYRQSDMQPMQM